MSTLTKAVERARKALLHGASKDKHDALHELITALEATPMQNITVTEPEVHAIRYALTELANRRAEQSIERKDAVAGRESHELRGLADRIVAELRQSYDTHQSIPA